MLSVGLADSDYVVDPAAHNTNPDAEITACSIDLSDRTERIERCRRQADR
jgi:hypothetical protein